MPISGDFDRLLSAALGLVALFYASRCVVGATLYLAGALPGRVGTRAHCLAERVTPALARRAAVTILGATVAGGAGLASAQAATVPPTPAATGLQHHAMAIPDLDRAPLPPAATGSAATTTVPERQEQADSGSYQVQPDDCLWDLAAKQLRDQRGGKPASPERIDRQWRRWYQLNKTTIGNDPSVILPRTHLRVPALVSARGSGDEKEAARDTDSLAGLDSGAAR
ncbi:MAG: hypothetical protein WCI74_03680 [Actinomycetes bacterium]